MTHVHLQPCAVLFYTPDHSATAIALKQRCEQQGLKVCLTQESTQAHAVFQQLQHDGLRPVLVVHGGGHQSQASPSALNSSAAELEATWRSICFAGSQIGQAAIRAMLPARQGTLLLLGHASAVHPVPGAAAYGSASAGLRAFAQSMARAFGPKGLHVAHLLIGGDMSGLGRPSPEAVAQACWMLHQQAPSTWTHELDLRLLSPGSNPGQG